LSQDGSAVVVDFFAGQAVVRVESVDAAQGELDAATGRRETAPSASMRAANHYFYQDGVVGDVTALDVDFEVWKGVHELLVELADSVAAFVVLVPGLVVVIGRVAEGLEDAFEVVFVLQADVLLDQGDAS
jgi:hypothetical protein